MTATDRKDPAHLLQGLRVSLPDIAATAKVQRPVVSMWRRRYSAGQHKFPSPVARLGQQPLFSAEEIAEWVSSTGRGRNSDFALEVLIRALSHGDAQGNGINIDALTALLRIKASSGALLADLAPADIVDLADDVDPADEDSFTEIEAAEQDLPWLVRVADALADAAYSPAAACESVLASLPWTAAQVPQVTLLPAAAELVAEAAGELAQHSPLMVVDPRPGNGDLLHAVLAAEERLEAPTAVLDPAAPRRLRRRLAAQGWHVDLCEMGNGFPERSLVVSAILDEGSSDVAALEVVEEIALRLAPGQRAVVLGPARALIDQAGDRVEMLRSQLLRTDRVRAAVLLPPGLVRERSREHLGLWVLGDAHPQVPIGKRWVMVADLSGAPLGPSLPQATIQDLLTDLVAAMGTADQVAAHAFRFARFTLTSKILAAGTGLVERSRPVPRGPREDDGATSAHASELLVQLRQQPQRLVTAQPQRGAATAVRRPRVGELLERGALHRYPGHRIPESAIARAEGAPGEVSVLGAAEVSGQQRPGTRALDRMELAARFPASRLTEPGDVVFTHVPRPAAIVDIDGLSVVTYPAQVLRIQNRNAGLVPHLLAQDINTQSAGARRWRDWLVRLAPPAEAGALSGVLEQIEHAQQELRLRQEQLQELAQVLAGGVAGGVIRLGHDETGAQASITE